MAEKTRTCPQCGGVMLLRLGEYQCQQCPNVIAAQAEGEQRGPGSGYGAPTAGRSVRDPGIQNSSSFLSARASTPAPDREGPVSPASYYGYGESRPSISEQRPSGVAKAADDPGAAYRGAPPPPPAGTGAGYLLGGVPPADLYAHTAGERRAQRGRSGEPNPALEIEKKVFLGIIALSLLTNAVIGFFIPAPPSFHMTSVGIGVSSLVGTVLGTAIIWFALYGEALWFKYCCGAWHIFLLICMLALGFLATSLVSSIPEMQALQGLAGGALWAGIIVGMLFNAWFLSILWRDIQRRQMGY